MGRKDLIKLCEDAVVHHTKWMNRDSYCAQLSRRDIYKGLTAGLKFRVVTKDICPDYYSNENTIIIEFTHTVDFDKLKKGKDLRISSLEDYFRDCDPEHKTEMFDGTGIDFDSEYTKSYIPTRKRVKRNGIGNDWY